MSLRKLESAVKGLLHGDGMASAFAELKDLGVAEVLARSLVMFCALLPFFALRETARAVGERKLEDFFLRSRAPGWIRPCVTEVKRRFLLGREHRQCAASSEATRREATVIRPCRHLAVT
jgi:hypothetical protein